MFNYHDTKIVFLLSISKFFFKYFSQNRAWTYYCHRLTVELYHFEGKKRGFVLCYAKE
nr:MAG TPA: hypothetical protein [Caudoviricetes sp.]